LNNLKNFKNKSLASLDMLINWARKYSLWPSFFGLSCCFIEESAALTPRYDMARFGAEVLRGSPRQSDLLITSGTIFKKVAPVILRLYEQMAEPKWVISMGSCSNCGGMYDAYSVVQGIDQILPVDVYIPGCPPRPEAVLQALLLLQKKIETEKPARPVLHLPGGTQGSQKPVLVEGRTKSRDSRGPGYEGLPVRGTDQTPPFFWDNRSELMWTPPPHRLEIHDRDRSLTATLQERFGKVLEPIPDPSDMVTFIVTESRIKEVLRFLKTEASPRFLRLDDLTAVDESARRDKGSFNSLDGTAGKELGLRGPGRSAPKDPADYTLVYQLLSFDPPGRLRLKVPLFGKDPLTASITDLWPSADWYEREVYDLFGIGFNGHPNLRRILMPHDWEGHPLRKDYPGRATEMPPFTLAEARKFQPLDAGIILRREGAEDERLFLNLGPHHVGTHGLMRFVLALTGERISDIDMDIGYHHRAVEKIGERQSWHQFIPYTDRVDYLSGVYNNLAYLHSLETLTGLEVPIRAQFIRVLLGELFRLSNHLVWFGTFLQDVGAIGPVFYTFREREMIMDIVEHITGGRLHPSWFRLGGVAADLPEGWRDPIEAFIKIFPARLKEYESLATKNPIFEARTRGIGRLSLEQAMEWGVTGANLRASGLKWDLRKQFPYSSYELFDFEIPYAQEGDCYARYLVRVEEMRQSLRIIEQAVRRMPEGPYSSDDVRYTLPRKEDTLKDIESLIHHFINTTRGPKIPKGEAYGAVEAPRGEQGYYLVSDGLPAAYRLRIRTPGFANLQVLPLMARDAQVSDLLAVIGSIDYILPDIDR
jgi:NADH dehydrogenase I D subunit